MKNKPKLLFGGQSKPYVNMHEHYSDTKLQGAGTPSPPTGQRQSDWHPDFSIYDIPLARNATAHPYNVFFAVIRSPGTCKTGGLLVYAPHARKITIHFHSGTQFSGSACVHTYIIYVEKQGKNTHRWVFSVFWRRVIFKCVLAERCPGRSGERHF